LDTEIAVRFEARMRSGFTAMNIYDPLILALPLYDERHRQLAARVEQWGDHISPRLAELDNLHASEFGRRMTRILGDEKWFEFVAGTQTAAPDFRSIALIREGFAFIHDLCDFAFSIQALAATPLIRHGTPAQRERWLPDIIAGRLIGSLAISEPDAGSNVAAIALRAERKDDVYVLNGNKTWISNGDIADFHSVLVRTGEGPGALGLSMLLVPADAAGLTAEAIDFMAPRAFASLAFRDCVVPADHIIGKPGTGFAIAMDVLESYRLTVGSAAIGFARRAQSAAIARCRSRQLGNGTLFDTEFAKDTLVDAEVASTAAALLVAQAAWLRDHDRSYAKHSSIAKLFATETSQRIIDDVVQLFGAAGMVRGSLPERLYRQIRSLRIYEGTSEIQYNIIANHLQRRS
jgi:acyl-CoA dehydrogenase